MADAKKPEIKPSDILKALREGDAYSATSRTEQGKASKDLHEAREAFKAVRNKPEVVEALAAHEAEVKKLTEFAKENKDVIVAHGDHFHPGDKYVEHFELAKGADAKAHFEANLGKELGAKTEAIGAAVDQKAAENVTKYTKTMNGATGMLKSEGIVGAVKNNLNPTKGRQMVAFGRMGGTALCALGLADGVFRSKTNNGEDRSVMTRLGEVGLFAAGAAALLLLGKAHIKAGEAVARAH